MACLAMLLFCGSYAQSRNPFARQIKEQAQQMGKLLIAKDYSRFIAYTHPDLIKAAGGKEKMLALLQRTSSQVERGGSRIKSITIGAPGPITDTANTLQCIVPEVLRISTPQGTLVSNASLLAISGDKGKTWTFTDVSADKMDGVRKRLPMVSSKIKPPVTTRRVE